MDDHGPKPMESSSRFRRRKMAATAALSSSHLGQQHWVSRDVAQALSRPASRFGFGTSSASGTSSPPPVTLDAGSGARTDGKVLASTP